MKIFQFIFLGVAVIIVWGCDQKDQFYRFNAAGTLFEFPAEYYEHPPKKDSQGVAASIVVNINTLEPMSAERRIGSPEDLDRLRIGVLKRKVSEVVSDKTVWKTIYPQNGVATFIPEHDHFYKNLSLEGLHYVSTSVHTGSDYLLNEDKHMMLSCTPDQMPNSGCKVNLRTSGLDLDLEMSFRKSSLKNFSKIHGEIEELFKRHVIEAERMP